MTNCLDHPCSLFRPVVVAFEELTAREEVLRKAGMLKGSKVYITEDMSRYGIFLGVQDLS